MKTTKTLSVAVTAASILATALVTSPAMAGDDKKKVKKSERCADIVKGGKNSCAVKSLGISCQGHAKDDNMKGAWIKVPTGTCANIVAICKGDVEAPESAKKKKIKKACKKIADQTDPTVLGGRLVNKFGEAL